MSNQQTELEKLVTNQNYLLLKAQKTVLNALIEHLSNSDGKFYEAECLALNGVINLIDAMQEIAVDQFQYPEYVVFNLTDEMTKEPALSLVNARKFIIKNHA